MTKITTKAKIDKINKLYFDSTFEHKCTNCGNNIEIDFNKTYISQPKVGFISGLYFICPECKKEYKLIYKIEELVIIITNIDIENVDPDRNVIDHLI